MPPLRAVPSSAGRPPAEQADAERAEAAAGLESAKGILRSEVGRAAGVKFTPTLTFMADALPDTARTIENLLDKARASDEKVREASAGAAYAGDADPYKKPGEEDGDVAE